MKRIIHTCRISWVSRPIFVQISSPFSSQTPKSKLSFQSKLGFTQVKAVMSDTVMPYRVSYISNLACPHCVKAEADGSRTNPEARLFEFWSIMLHLLSSKHNALIAHARYNLQYILLMTRGHRHP